MIAFGCSVSEAEPYARYAGPGIELAAEPDSEVFAFAAVGTIGRTYNLLLDAAARHSDLEALVLVHPHAEITDPDLCQKVRAAFEDPEVAVVGCAGARSVGSMAWWDGELSSGPVRHRYTEYRGGELPAFAWRQSAPPGQDVEIVDGFMFVLSPWAVRNLRFDEGLALGHGFDVDFCLEVGAAGKRLRTADFHVVLHRSLELVSDAELWVEAHMAIARKWEGRMPARPGSTDDWRRRARRAEAEREAARAIAYSKRLAIDARIEELDNLIEQSSSTVSWRLTLPLRRANKLRRDLWARARTEDGRP